MNNIYLVVKHYDNGWNYEEHKDFKSNVYAFPTREEAEQYIKEMDIPKTEFFDSEENEAYFEVHEGDKLFEYFEAYDKQFRRYFLHKDECGIYESLVYFVEEIPFG